MRKKLYVLAVLVPMIALAIAGVVGFAHISGARAATTCLPTGYTDPNEGVMLTAAVIATTTTVSGKINANGCDIGVYYAPGITGSVKSAEIFGAKYYGVVNNGASVKITNSSVHNIGDQPFDGVQRGVAIYFSYDSGASGTISGNTIFSYQKNGITVDGPSNKATITKNTVYGQGPVNYIAQNGIEVGLGAKTSITNNKVSGNSYTGPTYSAAGILVFGGSCYGGPVTTGTQITGNILIGNDVGVYASNLDSNSCVPTTLPTKLAINNNTASNDAVNNGGGSGYQAGISDQGNVDKIMNNSICGVGYTPVASPPPYLYMIDVTDTNNPIVSGNTSCSTGAPITPSSAAVKTHGIHHLRASVLK